jgi:transcriptional regulator with XRE-family HTH domain
MNRTVVGRNVRRLRNKASLTGEELARRAGLSSVRMIEAGRTGCSVETLERLAKTLTRALRRKVGVAELLKP